jgi:4-amino-4-deoxy-L-arabinose transferase-like glycosyltransferase
MNISNAVEGGEQHVLPRNPETPDPGTIILRRFGLLSILLLSLAMRLWRLAQNEWGNEYYAAGVRSMTLSWHNFFYNSFDPAGFVSVDKPPVALWIQVAAAKLFGFSTYSLFIPQVLEGVASVWILYHLVQRRFGAWAGLMAGFFLAVTPVSVAIDRSNNTDSCLILVLLLAAWALVRAAEEGDRRLLILSLALIGLGFNVKMLAAFVVLPTFALVYCLAAPLTRRRRLEDLAIAAVMLVVVSLAWVSVYDLTPPDHRPFAGTSKGNSMLELAVGPYAVGRFVSPLKRSESSRENPASISQSASQSRLSRLFVRVPMGPLRLADGRLAGQVGWLVPFAVMGLLISGLRGELHGPMSRSGPTLLLLLGWALTYGVVYSFAGGIMHFYYLATMAPPLAALAGIGAVLMWELQGQKGWKSALLPATLLVTVVWQLYIEAAAFGWKLEPATLASIKAVMERPDWLTCVHVVVVAGTCLSVAGLFALNRRQSRSRTIRALAACMSGTGLASLLVLPIMWALSCVLVPGHGILPSADPVRLLPDHGQFAPRLPGGFAKHLEGSKLLTTLQANRQGERFLLATSNARLASPIIILTGEAVMAMGGFHGLDPILNPVKLAHMVKKKQIRFVMLGDLSVISRKLGAEAAISPLAEWVEANGKLVDSRLWRSGSGTGSRLRLFDLRPSEGLVSARHR